MGCVGTPLLSVLRTLGNGRRSSLRGHPGCYRGRLSLRGSTTDELRDVRESDSEVFRTVDTIRVVELKGQMLKVHAGRASGRALMLARLFRWAVRSSLPPSRCLPLLDAEMAAPVGQKLDHFLVLLPNFDRVLDFPIHAGSPAERHGDNAWRRRLSEAQAVSRRLQCGEQSTLMRGATS